MTSTSVPEKQAKAFLSEVFTLRYENLKTFGFQLSPLTNREDGLRLSFRLSRQFPNAVVVWSEGSFFGLVAQSEQIPNAALWQVALENVQAELSDNGDRTWSFRQLQSPQLTEEVIAQLAEQVLRVTRPFTSSLVYSEKNIEVRRRADFGRELVHQGYSQEVQKEIHAAISISASSRVTFHGTLADFFANHPFRNRPQELLIGLKVEDIDSGSTATVVELVGVLGEKREQLLEKASGSTSRQALRESPDDQPVVGVKFGRTSKSLYHYPLAALRPCITAETADPFDVDYGSLLKATKINHSDRQSLIQQYRSEAAKTLALFGLQLRKSVNTFENDSLFWQPSQPVDSTQLLFGNGVKSTGKAVLSGLSRGGVYQRHERYYVPDGSDSQPIRMTVLNLFQKNTDVKPLIKELRQLLEKYRFDSLLLSENLNSRDLPNSRDASGRAQLDELINELMVVPTDIFLIFLPTSDRGADDSESGSLYHRIYSKLIRRGIASQFIYEDTLRSTPAKYLLNQITPGILAKLGNLPYVLAQPLSIADYFIGLDVSRTPKRHLAGSMNACAGVCLYGNQGQFIRSHTESAAVEGEEIPQRFLEVLLPASDLRGKTVLIYRDGRFRGQEVEHLLGWANAIGANFILVECIKSGVPRLYGLDYKVRQAQILRKTMTLNAPDRGLALCLSEWEAILVTTKVPENVGLARPLRINIRPEGHQVHIHSVLDATLKLTLLHHGALKPPRLPMVLHGADRLASLRLSGVFVPECDRQFWL